MMQVVRGIRNMSSSSVKHAVSELSFPVPWGEIRGQAWGPDHGHPVLCLHGWADNCGSFKSLVPLLPKEYRYVAVDLPGHGLSSHRPPGAFYSFPLYVMDVHRVVDALQWSRFSIIGHSMGGNIAGMYSALFPEKVEALVLLDSYGFLPTDEEQIPKVMRQGMESLMEFEKKTNEKEERVYTYEKAAQRLLAANPTLSEESLHILLERGLVQVEGGVKFTRDFRLNLKNIVRITLQQSLEMQSRIKASTLIVLAENGFDKMVSEKEQKKAMSALLEAFRDRNRTVVTVPGDHHVHLNDPASVAPLVSDFLQSTALAQSERRIDEKTSRL